METTEEMRAEIARLRQEAWAWSKACEQACQTAEALRADCIEAVSMLQDATTLNGPGPDFALHWWARRGELASKYLGSKQ